MNARPLWGSVVLYFFAALIVVISVYPFLYTVATSLKSGTELFSTSLMPDNPSLNNYITLFKGKQPFGTQLGNSVMVATTTVVLSMLMAVTEPVFIVSSRYADEVAAVSTDIGAVPCIERRPEQRRIERPGITAQIGIRRRRKL